MAFKFTKTTYSPVEFGELGAFTPTMTVERRLRVQRLKFDEPEEALESLKYMAECFEGHAEEITKFFSEVDILQWYKLQAYLIGGDKMINQVETLDQVVEKEAKNG